MQQIVPHVFKKSLEEKTPAELIELGRAFAHNKEALNLVQTEHYIQTGKIIAPHKLVNQELEGLTMALFISKILSENLSWLIKGKGISDDIKKEYVSLHRANIGFIQKILSKGKGHNQFRELIEDLNSERVKDLGELFSLIMYISDTSPLYNALLEDMRPEGWQGD